MGRKVIVLNKTTAIVIEPFKNDYGDYIGIREFWKPKDADDDEDWRPSQKGLSIPVEKIVSVRKKLKWAEENFEDEHKVLSNKKKSKSKDDEDDKPKKKKSRN